MNIGRIILVGLMLVICTIASIRVLIYGVTIEERENLLELKGVLSEISCKKNRIRSIKLRGNATRFWIKQNPNKLPSCDNSRKEWTEGSKVELLHTPISSSVSVNVYELSINGTNIYSYVEAVKSMNFSKNVLLTYTVILWGFICYIFWYRKNKHNK